MNEKALADRLNELNSGAAVRSEEVDGVRLKPMVCDLGANRSGSAMRSERERKLGTPFEGEGMIKDEDERAVVGEFGARTTIPL